jgi:hypothetical protein
MRLPKTKKMIFCSWTSGRCGVQTTKLIPRLLAEGQRAVPSLAGKDGHAREGATSSSSSSSSYFADQRCELGHI